MRSSVTLLLSFSIISLVFLILFSIINPCSLPISISSQIPSSQPKFRLKVYVADLPRSLNYGLLDHYWSLSVPDSRIGADPDEDNQLPPYPENPLIKQYSAEYWLFGDLVYDWRGADVVFVPFFATLSAEMELGWGRKGNFLKKDGNGDYMRQREAVDRIKRSEAWKRSGGWDHVFVLTDPVAMWHVRAEIASAILLVVDFGGWYKLDAKASQGNSSDLIQHTQVSLLKDIVVPYTHLLPRLQLSEDRPRHTLLYFKGAKHRHRGGLVREKLWDLLLNEDKVVMEEGFPNAMGRDQSIKGMRSSEFCLHPAGDTPTSCRLFDAILSLCIPVIISDNIELPFEGMVDYSDFSVFISVSSALRPGWLVDHLKSISEEQKKRFRKNMAIVQPVFEYDNGRPGGLGPAPSDGAVNYIWRKVQQKLPVIKEGIARERRKPAGVSIPLRCHCM
ncbi:putative glycosyltransferase [Apostasia shenzhenica]|uniref:Putative glycosyltransferase n=1 Tax=Apostasia shenzhenica TaxID=1088818 RepID=A0A2I0A9M1_9ASPA|nr:putative glycosyltransferase [Apostasia shenzhenica]